LNRRNKEGYILEVADLSLAPDIGEAGQLISTKNLYGALITNQSAITRRILTPGKLELINSELGPFTQNFKKWIVEICPHVPAGNCKCRKPAPGLIQNALIKLGITAREAVFIGDSKSDFEAARESGVKFIGTCWDSLECLPAANCGHSLLNAVRLAMKELGSL
jgi:histidinol-phosphate phosphatase family protein